MTRKSWWPKHKADSYIAPWKQRIDRNSGKEYLEAQPWWPTFQQGYSFPNLSNHYDLGTKCPDIRAYRGHFTCKPQQLLLSFAFVLKILIPEGSSPIVKGKKCHKYKSRRIWTDGSWLFFFSLKCTVPFNSNPSYLISYRYALSSLNLGLDIQVIYKTFW